MSEFLAEAQVLVRPNTAGFRAELVAQLETATRGLAVPIPVVATAGAQGVAAQVAATTEAVRAQAVATDAAAAAAQKATITTSAFTRAQTAGATAAKALALAESGVANATTAVSAAQTVASRSVAARAAAERALDSALAAKNIALIDAASNTLRLAQAQEAEAATALQAARAQAAHASQLEFVRRGAGATGLSLLGVRGATLAANSAFLIGAAGVAVLAKSLGVAASFEKQLNVFAATSRATADELERVGDAARELGSDVALPGVSASDAAESMTELAKAGLAVQDSIDGARGVLLLATAAEIENAQATEIVANALNSFGLAGVEAVRVADLLAGASIAAQGSIADMGGALTQAASVSRQVGISLEDTVALLTLLAKNGIQGASAGTVLRVALLRLVNPVGQAADVIERLGLNIRDAQGRVRPEIFAEFAEATRDLTKAQRDAAAAQVFGVRGIRAQAILGREGIDALNETRRATQEVGQAQELAEAQTKGFSGEVENLKNQLEEAGISIGNLAKGPLGLLVQSLAANVQIFNAVAGAVGNTASEIKDLIQPATDVGNAVLNTTQKVGTFLDELTEGIPVLDGFFEPLEEGADSADKAGAAFDRLADSVESSINRITAKLEELGQAGARGLTAEQILGRIAGLEEQVLDVRARGGSAAEELALRRQEVEVLNRRLERDNLSLEGRRKLKKERDRVLSLIESLERQMASEARAAADRIATAQREADEALLGSLGGRRAEAENRILIAARSETLRDDIRRNKEYLALLDRQIENVRKNVRDVERRARELQALNRQRIQVENEIARLEQEQRDAAAAARRERRERIRESLSLDIQISQATGNRQAEIRAREAEIKRIQAEIRQTRRGTLQRKRLILELREAQKSLRELQAERKKTSDITAEAFFNFLQSQQGFAANLLGNLIPLGATQGLVGQPSPQREIEQQAALTGARERGFTIGQGDQTNTLLREILEEIRRGNLREAHPEARTQRRMGSAAMDTVAM